MPQSISTGYAALDSLIGEFPVVLPEAFEDFDLLRPIGQQEVPVEKAPPCLGFPRGVVTVVDGDVPEGWAQRLGAPVWDCDWATFPSVFGSKPAIVFAHGCPEGLNPRLPRLSGILKTANTALVFAVGHVEVPLVLKYYAHLRLRFENGRVTVIKCVFNPKNGCSIPWSEDAVADSGHPV